MLWFFFSYSILFPASTIPQRAAIHASETSANFFSIFQQGVLDRVLGDGIPIGFVGRLAQLVERTLCILGGKKNPTSHICVRPGFRISYRPTASFSSLSNGAKAQTVD